MIAPSVSKLKVEHFICGNTFRCVWKLREYPTVTKEQAIRRKRWHGTAHLYKTGNINRRIPLLTADELKSLPKVVLQ